MSERPIELPATFVLVALLILAPALIRAQQHLDSHPITPVFSFSREGEAPPSKVTIDPPGQLITCAAVLVLPATAAPACCEPVEADPPRRAPIYSSPDPQRGPPAFLRS